ncbi:MAG: hypothetical protein II078_06965, partial [Muribaculaceae bacterium]|nr:hypothetical protein [Muribaculaceae bacterium]
RASLRTTHDCPYWPSSRPVMVVLHPPHATQTCGLCAVGLAQVEALGLVEVFDLVRSTGHPHPPEKTTDLSECSEG